jgi:hypothetical protein
MLKKVFDFEFKGVSDKGQFEGLLSPYYPYVDSVGDTVMPGAYTQTLRQKGATRPLLWMHKADEPIGTVTLEDRQDGLYANGQLLLDTIDGSESWKKIKAGVVRGLSIGFIPVRDKFENGVRKLQEIALYEASVVTFPAAEAALIQSVKSSIDTTTNIRIHRKMDSFIHEVKSWKPQF